ncbi:hypothetical protein ACOSP7_002845 [Xanthoceras sorbifolium]
MLLLLIVSTAKAHVFDVCKYGAKADGNKILFFLFFILIIFCLSSQALSSAFKEACESPTPSKVLIPKGTFLLGQVKLEGPCKAALELEVQGTVIAKTEPGIMKEQGSWVTFERINGFTMFGGGTFDGQGPKAWGTCGKSYCKQLPIIVHTKDSKQFHVNLLRCNNLAFRHFTISAPDDSINTDGIHIGRSSGINISDSNIATGDDCVSIGQGSQQITIANVNCGPGHGISIGSLGKIENEESVVGITVRNCTFSNTQNGVRIKTWPASFKNAVSDVKFEDIIMNNVSSPIIIDQIYCPYNRCNKKHIRGTSATPVAVELVCSSGIPCEGVEVADIDLKYIGEKATEALSVCSNVRPKIMGKQSVTLCSHSP